MEILPNLIDVHVVGVHETQLLFFTPFSAIVLA